MPSPRWHARCLALVLLLPGLACDSKPTKADGKAESADAKGEPDASEAKPAQSEAKPAPMAPAPEGAVVIDRVYVHTCAATDSCPALLQDAGAAHCKSLTLGGLSWRLPTVEELESWRGNEALSGYDVFHWSGSAWDEDPGQFWMYDPGSGSKTTAKPDRKPFTIRCVAQP
ncbi:hypothetical protein [Paraliomyxa miuraensis]|uniref:hypothetical protein n=1 Tax=Paraliomyxa miuraensis TaxID=376150 RepID=UPI002257662A|nr:hypothetical protein [Paraliomyxa miuraensis]MCX4240617.1 DUF1566 domain-containing protein [Paraliomyxa miuraensis]